MGYQSLKVPREDTPDDSDDSIQGSPLLDTGPKFASNSADMSFSALDDGDPGTPYAVRYEPTEYEKSLQDSPYDNDADYGVSYENGYTSVLSGSPSYRSPLQQQPLSNTLQLHQPEKSPGHMAPVLEHPESEATPEFEFQNEFATPNGDFDASAADIPKGSATSTSPQRSFSRGNELSSRSPTAIKASIKARNRMSLPPRLSSLEDSALPADDDTSLDFERKDTRPRSSLIKSSFSETRAQFQDDGDDDALPFEATKQMAWQGRPQSMVQLSQLNRGPVMSKETFENYRKSVSTLDSLKHMSSRGSFRSNSLRRQNTATSARKNSEQDTEAEEDELEDEEESHEKERKRKSALLRQEQDARMSVYRQKMTKMIGGSSEPTMTIDSTRAVERDSPQNDDSDTNEMMDDIPLSILQAHGFPKARAAQKSRPTSYHSSDPRPSSMLDSSSSKSPSTSPRPLSMAMSVATSRMSTGPHTSPGLKSASPGPPNGRKVPSWTPPNVFGNKNGMLARGLVAEIAKEEEYRKRRNTYGFGGPSPQEFGANSRDDRGSIAPSSASVVTQPGELQVKLDQVLDMLSKLSTNEAGMMSPMGHSPGMIQPVMASSGMPSPGMPSPGMQSPGLFPLPGYAQQRAPSVRSSYTTQSSHSAASLHNKWMPPNTGPRASYMGTPNGQYFPPGQVDPHLGPAPMQSFGPRGKPQVVSNRPSRMRIIKAEEEEDDDAEWQKMVEKRKELRDQWKNQEEVPSA